MAFEKKLEFWQYAPSGVEVAGHMVENWEKHLNDAAELVKDKLDEKLPDEESFQQIVVQPSTSNFAPFVNPGFVSKSERSAENIRATRQSNLSESFTKWKNGIGKAFETVGGVVAKFFKDRVSAAKDLWASKVSGGTLRFTGDKIRGLGIAPIIAYALVGDQRASTMKGSADILIGQPYNIARPYERTSLKAAVVQRIIQGGMMIVKSGFNPDTIDKQNDINAKVLTGQRDTTKADAFVATYGADKCFCLWEVDTDGRLLLHTQVGITV